MRESCFVRLAQRRPTLIRFLRDVDAHTVIDVVTIVREAQIIVLVGVLLAGFAAVRDADAPRSG